MRRHARGNPLLVLSVASLLVLAGLFYLLSSPGRSVRYGGELTLYCAAGMRVPIEKIAADYEQQYGVQIRAQFEGSGTLLGKLQINKTGDLYLAADNSYTDLAREKGLVAEVLPLAMMKPVIAVPEGNPRGITGISDLLRNDVRVALGSPEQAAIGKQTRKLLTASGHWQEVEEAVRRRGVFKPTVNEIANDVKLGAVDAAVIWDAVVRQYEGLAGVNTPELDKGLAHISLGVLTSSSPPSDALRFARFVAASDRGLKTFREEGFEVVEGDVWAEVPELTFFAGSVNRQALEPVVEDFQQREGVRVDTVYNGCGILTATMRSIEQNQESGFPDMYMACDVYYLEAVSEMFEPGVNVSNTAIVIVVQEGNPKDIRGLSDLTRPGVRVALGQPDQCTIGVLSKRLLESEGIYQQLLENNVVTQTTTSALLIPSITARSADAVLAYATDTRKESDKLDVIPIDSPLAKAVQPYTISKTSRHKQLAGRLFQAIAGSRDTFEAAGFVWRLGEDGSGDSPAAAPGQDGEMTHDVLAVPKPLTHRVASDAPFYTVLVVIGGTYLFLILAMLLADAAYVVAGIGRPTISPEWSAEHVWLSWLVDNPVGAALANPHIRSSLQLTMISCTATTILSLWVAVPIGYLLSRHQFPGKNLVDSILDIPIVLPPLVVGLSLLILFQYMPRFVREAIVYEVPAVVLAQFMVACAFAVRTMRATFDQIDARREQVALTLGCTRMQAFSRVVLPETHRGMLTAATLAWARSLGEFGPLLIFAGATRGKTEVLSTTVFLELSIGDLEAAVAVSLIMVVSAVLVLVIARIWGSRNLTI